MRRRLALAGLGALSGLLAGTGVAIVVTQSGRIGLRHFATISMLSIVAGVALALIAMPRWLNRATAFAGVAILIFSLFAAIAPARAQTPCDLTIASGGPASSLLATTPEAPFTIDLSQGETYDLVAITPAEATVVEVVARQVLHLGFVADIPERVLWYGPVTGGIAAATVTASVEGGTGGRLVVRDSTGPSAAPIVSDVPPWGAIELEMRVDGIAGGVRSNLCTESLFLKLVATPMGTPLGKLGVAATVAGLAGLAGTAILRRRWLDPAAAPVRTGRQPPVTVIGEPIPSVGRHAPYIESNFVDPATNEPVDPSEPLIAGREYTLRLNLSPALRAEESEEEVPISIKASGDAVTTRPVVQLGIAGTPLQIDVPVQLNRTGRQEVDVDLLSAGHLLQTEHYELTVVAAADTVEQAVAGQTVTTVFSASDFSQAHLRSLKPRALLIILQHDATDGSVDSRVLDPAGNLIVRFDNVLQPEALTKTAGQVRKVLRSVIGSEESQRTVVADEDVAASLIRLARVGRLMHQTLFPAEIQPGAPGSSLSQITADSIIQAVQNGAGLGLATMPWNLIYDRPFEQSGAGNSTCPQFPDHEIDACPNVADARIVCPTGFWGFRFVLEQPMAGTDSQNVPDEQLPQPSTVAQDGVATAYLDDTLSYAAPQRQALARSAALIVPESYDDVIARLRSDANDLFYFYTHHAQDPDLGIPGVYVDGHIITGSALRDLQLRWTRRPLVFVNACASGDYGLDDPLSLIHEFRMAGAAGVVTTECTVFDPGAGRLAHRVLDALIAGDEVGTAILALRRELLGDDNNPLGFAYAIHALADATIQLQRAAIEAVAA